MVSSLTLRLGIAIANVLLLASLAPARADEAPTRRALLIGINDYLAVPSLNGAVNDVEMIQEVLTTRFGFAPEAIEVVKDQEATREGIVAAIQRLAARTGPEDIVYLHYSGHGSQVVDVSGDESDREDETLVPHDGRTADIADITDDELAALLDEIPSPRVVVTLDSCHSGTATRAAAVVQARTVPPDPRTELYERLATRTVVPVSEARHLLMAGAADHEQALDGPVDGRSYGLFSYALARSLSSAEPGATPRAIFAHVGRELERIKAQLGLASMPQPQLEAPEARLEEAMFPRVGASETAGPTLDEGEARLPWLAVRPKQEGRVVLLRGNRLGALPGSTWAIYGPNERNFAPGGALAEATVEALRGEDAEAVLTPATETIAAGSRAIALSPAPVANRVPVRLGSANAEQGERLRAAIEELLPEVEYVGEDRFARFVVTLDEKLCKVEGADGSIEIASFPTGDEAQLARSLAALFARSMNAAELLALDNPAALLDLELGVVGQQGVLVGPSATEGRAILVASTEAPRYRIRSDGESRSATNSLQLRVSSSQECSLLLVDVDAEGGVHVLFPNALSEKRSFYPAGRIPAGETVLVPDSLAAGNRAGFHFDYAPPSGTDTVRAFCFLDERVAGMMANAIAGLGRDPEMPAGSSIPERKRVRSTLMDLLRPVLSLVSSRGIVVVADVGDVLQPVPAEPQTEPLEPAQPAETDAAVEPEVAEPSTVALEATPAQVRSDWAGAAVTVTVEGP